MGLFNKIFGGWGAEEPQVEVVENKWCTDLTRGQIRIRKQSQEMYAEELFENAAKPKDLNYDRFYQLNESPPGLHFAPTKIKGIDWFKGRNLPKDGYYNIFWGEEVSFQCRVCLKEARAPLTVTKVEKYTVFTNTPSYLEIVGWRVIAVASDLMGLGVPSKIIDLFKTIPIIKWGSGKNNYICKDCAQRLRELGREAELEEDAIF